MRPAYDFPPPQPARRSSGCGNRLIGCMFACVGVLGLGIFCCVGAITVLAMRSPQPPKPNFTPDVAQAQQFETAVAEAKNEVQTGGGFTLSITEDQASSWLNLNAGEYADANLQVENVQVLFRDGKAQIYAEADSGVGKVGTFIDVYYSLLPDGHVQISIDDISVGGVGIPGNLEGEVTKQLQSAIDRELGEINPNYRVLSISSLDGVLTIQGQGG